MKRIEFLYLSGLISENNFYSENEEKKHYMFFSSLESMKEKIEEILKMDKTKLDRMLDGHDWASDHIASSRDDIEEVYNWIKSEYKKK